MAKLRVRFAKLGKVRWTSHRDVARMWERAFRRVELPLAYTSGFSPRPKVSFGLALPTGHESVAEYLDLETTDESLDVQALPARFSAALPEGISATAVAWVDPRTPSLQEVVTSSTWRWCAVPADGHDAVLPGQMAERVARVLAAPEVFVTRTRKGQLATDDIRAGILDLTVVEPGHHGVADPAVEATAGLESPSDPDPTSGVWLEAELASKPRSLRPSDVLTALGTDLEERHVRRLHQWISRPGAREEPLLAASTPGATSAPHALVRA